MSQTEKNQNDTPVALPMGAVLFGLFCFSGMDAVMKSLALDLGTYNAILWRYAAGLLLIALLYVWRKPRWPRGVIMKIHIIRSIMIVFMAYGFFWGLTKVPLAEGVALSFIAPLIALYLAAIFLKETIHPRAIWASLFGLAGVGVMAYERVAGDYDPDAFLGFAAILASALLYAGNLVIQRYQAQHAGPIEVSFFQNLFVFLAYLMVAPWFADIPDSAHWPTIILAAALAVISILFVMWGYARAEAQVLVNLEYSAFIWAAILGWYFFDEPLAFTTIIGALLIVAGCILASRRSRRPLHVETTAV